MPPRTSNGQVTETMMRAATHRTAVLLAAAALAAGCSAPVQSNPAHGAGRSPARSAVAAAEREVHCGNTRQQPTAPLPAGFAADAAVLCAPAVRQVGGRGHVGYVKQVADRGLAPLVAALRRPSGQPTPGMICPTQLIVVPPLFLINRDGQIIRPMIPSNACHQPQLQVLNALRHVPWVTHAPSRS
jgi:hypothetical protein